MSKKIWKFTSTTILALISVITACADIVPPVPSKADKSDKFVQASLLAFAEAEDPDVAELVRKMDRGNYPDLYEFMSSEDGTPAINGNDGGIDEYSTISLYNDIAKMTVTGRTVKESDLSAGSHTVFITFWYEDAFAILNFFIDGETLYYANNNGLIEVKDPEDVIGRLRKNALEENEQAEWLDNLEGAVLKAKRMNWNMTDGSKNHLALTEFAVQPDGCVLSREQWNIGGYSEICEERMTTADKTVFMEILDSCQGSAENMEGADGYGWEMWKCDTDGKKIYEFTGYVEGNEKARKLADILEKYHPVKEN